MVKHKRIYMDHFGFGTDDMVPCEVCLGRAVDIHHIEARGMGGRKSMDVIENLMAVCRKHHGLLEASTFTDEITRLHELYMRIGDRPHLHEYYMSSEQYKDLWRRLSIG